MINSVKENISVCVFILAGLQKAMSRLGNDNFKGAFQGHFKEK